MDNGPATKVQLVSHFGTVTSLFFSFHSTPSQVASDNQWRTLLRAVLDHPLDFGMEGVQQDDRVPDDLVLALDETPVYYIPPMNKSYENTAVLSFYISPAAVPFPNKKQVYIYGCKERRSLTATPVISASGGLVAMQILFKGKTPAVLPRCQPTDCRTVLGHAPKRTQTTETFAALLAAVAQRLPAVRATGGHPPDYPAVILMDNAPSHSVSLMKPVVRGGRVCRLLFEVAAHPGLYVFFLNPMHGLP
jgi:hypothetical protein